MLINHSTKTNSSSSSWIIYSATLFIFPIIKQPVIRTKRPNNFGACIDIHVYRVSCKSEYSLNLKLRFACCFLSFSAYFSMLANSSFKYKLNWWHGLIKIIDMRALESTLWIWNREIIVEKASIKLIVILKHRTKYESLKSSSLDLFAHSKEFALTY